MGREWHIAHSRHDQKRVTARLDQRGTSDGKFKFGKSRMSKTRDSQTDKHEKISTFYKHRAMQNSFFKENGSTAEGTDDTFIETVQQEYKDATPVIYSKKAKSKRYQASQMANNDIITGMAEVSPAKTSKMSSAFTPNVIHNKIRSFKPALGTVSDMKASTIRKQN